MRLTRYLVPCRSRSQVGDRAGKEFQIEQALRKMKREWESVDLFVDGYRETGTFILKHVDDLQTLLDEHVTMSQAMQFSAFKKPFEEVRGAHRTHTHTLTHTHTHELACKLTRKRAGNRGVGDDAERGGGRAR